MDHFVWSDAADEALEDLKRQLAKPHVLAAPVDKEPLLLYVAANARAVSVAIVVEHKEAGKEYPVQRPVYYYQRGAYRVQTKIPTLAETSVWSFYGKPKAQALFSGSSYHSGQFIPLGRYHPKQRSNWPDC